MMSSDQEQPPASGQRRCVVVATDGTDASAGAIEYAVQEARSRVAALRLVHVAPGYVPMMALSPMVEPWPAVVAAAGEKLLVRARDEVRERAPDLGVEAELRRGSRSKEILGVARDAELLVMGCETRVGLDRVASGATTVKVAARARCPVMVVPSRWRPGPVKHRLVVGLRSTHHAERLMPQLFQLASSRGDSLLLVHARKLPETYVFPSEAQENVDEWIDAGRRLLDAAVADWSDTYPGVEVTTRLVHMDPVAALLEAEGEADLLVLARRFQGPLPFALLGGTARALLRSTAVPVLVLPVDDAPAP